jgi:hypothetical protein
MRIRFCIAAALVAMFGLSASAQGDPAPTASVTASVSVAAIGAAVGSATVIVPAGGDTPGGTVTYSVFASGACPAGAAFWSDQETLDAQGNVPNSAPTEPLAAGNYDLDAAYSGDLNYQAATSDCVPFTVAPQPQPQPQQPVTLTASANPTSATYGNTIGLSAVVQPAAATGTVTFTDAGSGSELCQASLSLGGASCTTPVLAPGTYDVTVGYHGDASDQPATAATTFTIAPAPATAPAPTTTTTTATTAFHFIIPPSITVTQPVNGARYTRDEPVLASYSCRDGSDAPGLTSCSGTVASGARIDTSQTGTHTFTVTGTSRSGESTLRTLHYVVATPANQIAVFQPVLGNDGNGTVTVRVPGPGTITVLQTGWPEDRSQPRVGHQTVLSRGRATARKAGKVPVKIRLAATGRRLLGHSHGSHLRVRLFITYTPTGGVARQTSKYGVLAIR